MTLGENIARLRAQKNWSQGDLAGELDVSRQSVSKWETDASVPELDKLMRLAELFGVTLDALVHGGDAPQGEGSAPAEAPQGPQSHPPMIEKRHTTAGTALLCTGAAVFVLCLLLFGSLLTGLAYALPFLACGVICFTAKRRAGLWCGWAVYACADLYLRFAAGLSWGDIRMTHLWTPEMNYARLAAAWMQFLAMLVLLFCTLRSYRGLCLPAAKRRLLRLGAGWLALLAVLPLLMHYAMLPLWPALSSGSGSYLGFSLFQTFYDALRLALAALLLVRSFAVWRAWRAGKRTAGR